jgi:hypothetical protein
MLLGNICHGGRKSEQGVTVLLPRDDDDDDDKMTL